MMLLLTLLLVCQVSKVTVDGGDAGTETMVNVANVYKIRVLVCMLELDAGNFSLIHQILSPNRIHLCIKSVNLATV
jgi:hypothetical protein